MNDSGFTLFDTPLGPCGIAWGQDGLRGLQLPEPTEAGARARLARRFPDLEDTEPPESICAITVRIVAHLGGGRDDYADVPIDFARVGDWEASVYRAALAIPAGETRTYGQLASGLGDPGAAQAVGQALGRNPWPIVVPCHRITAADGRTGGFSAPGGAATKLKLLEIEGALAAERLPLFAPRDA
ncbi:methylated-DNA--[protein]-cysteine S-methyltransferase [Sphingosinicella sp. LHD-64]|uniref:methylated-DNA--[protein]-cysteine S-methyltransferase n=1 Tax=Sphingosinicella sp. LHD-64 TaxID=3072139 RepID=UPI00280F8C33|nr:methylated-DNA--[protein]-cysteine S-methyltransferase [Sphingosinicella sp. LHD-64]MDQ8755137.1 methylated-DNA--[protein]-cysteine S-methyltransferase [Sphingosinicella sp. LHD-64]